jgi:ribonuclease HI
MYKLYTDGGSRGNPGHAAIGYALYLDEKEFEVFGEYIGIATNNIAEYRALEAGLKRLKELGAKEIGIFMDSELVVNQLKGAYKVKNPEIKIEYSKIKSLLESFGKFSVTYVPREKNKIADKQVNLALDTQLLK